MNKKLENEIDIVIEAIIFVFGVFLLALCYNLFFLPNALVTGGVSGISIAVNSLFGINANLFVYVANIILLIVSYFLLGKDKTKNTLLGAILYPLMITFSAPIASFILKYSNLDDFLFLAIMSGIVHGVGNGFVYKYGYSTGGSDTIVAIITKYFKVSEGKAILFIDTLIILLGVYAFGITKAMYAILIVIISSSIVDRIIYGINRNKVFYVFTRKPEKVQKIILNEFESGFTILPTKGGYSHEDGILIMCVLSNKDYFNFRKRILEIDSKAFFVINDCYEYQGGYSRKKLPF